MKKNILRKKAITPKMAMMFGERPAIAGKLEPPKYNVEIIADEMNILMYSANK
jgi:hypothetical protein